MRALDSRRRESISLPIVLCLILSLVVAAPVGAAPGLAPADATYQTLPFSQNWTNIGLITVSDDWSGVPGIVGFRGDNLTAATGADPQTILADDTPGVVDVNANQTNPDTFTTGGVTEFHIADPVVALSGSGTADAPYIQIYLDTSGYQSINIAYNLRDIDGSTDDAVQQIALHYRLGTSGTFTNVPAAYVADATTGPSLATLVTPVNVTLPAAVDNQTQVQLRVMTTNAVGNDEWVGIDDISITGTPISGDLPPTVTDVTPNDGATNVPVDATVDVTFSEPVTIAGTIAIACTSGTQNVTPTGGPTTFVLPHADFAPGDGCTVTILASQVTDQDGTPTPMAADYTWGFEVAAGCFTASTPIHDIQGAGLTSPLVGQPHSVEALVVADYQSVSSIRGFFVEEPDGDQDADPATSEGLFIYDNNFGVDVAPGDYVRVTGFVSEFQNQTQLSSINAVTICSANPATATPANVVLPFADTAYPERFEGMSVVMTQTLTVNETYNLGRGAILTLSNGRLRQPTNVVLPGAPANALQAANNLNQITLDDGNLTQNPDPIVYPPPQLTALNTVRSGDTVSNVAGVLTQGNPGWTTPGNIYRINPYTMPTFTATNPRPAVPDPVRANGSLRVSSFNVLNYFLTIDNGANNCGPAQNQNCRGADSAFEFTRQRDKMLEALNTLNADVLGLMELENTPNVEPLQDIVNGLNAMTAPGTYAFINPGTLLPGDHVIKVGIVYKPAVVQPVGPYAILDASVDPNFNTALSRPAIAQTFKEVATNGRFTVIVNHLKSKGCTGATGLDLDQNDGQSCFNEARRLAANALATWAAGDPTGTGDPDVLIMGDLNSYAREDPMRALETAGYTNVETAFEGATAYSYVFSAQAGSLDHSMANASLWPQVNDATTWHINADEPIVLDYNVEFKNTNQQNILYNADPYRTSDHDPLLIGLNLTPSQPSIAITKTVGTVPGVCATTDTISVAAGTTVYYCYEVSNTGDVTLNLHDLADTELGTIFAGFSYALAPGSSIDTVAAGLSIPAVINATTVNTATWTAYNAGPIDVATATASARVTVLPPNIFVDPLAVASSQLPNVQTQHMVGISNTGGALLDWEIFEEPQSIPGPASPLPLVPFDAQAALADEIAGIERAATEPPGAPDPAARALAKQALMTTGLLLVPDSTNDRVMALDPITGNVIDPNFVPSNSVVGTGINAILSAGGDSILLSDQIGDVVHEFDLDGNYLGIFAPAGGVNNAILDNIRGISLRPNGHLLVTVASGANTNSVAEFDTSGNYLGNFIAAASGGLGSPWDPYSRSSDWLVSGSGGTTGILRYDLSGAFLNVLTPISTFPEQLDEAGNGNVLAANFSPTTNEGVLEYTSTGTFVGRYDPTGLSGYRGVYELPGGTILTTTGNGVHEIDRSAALVQNKITGVSARFIEYVAPPATCSNPADVPWLSTSPISGTTPGYDSTDVTVTLDSTGLAPNTYTANLCITSNDPDAGPGNETDLVVVPVTLTVTAPQVPAIALAKTVGTSPLACATTDEITVPAGTEVTYCYEVTNTGNVTLNYHDLDDSELGNIFTGLNYVLAPGASVFVTQTATINVTTVNTATWTAYNPDYVNLVTATDAATVTIPGPIGPAINLVKTVGTTPGVCAATDNITVTAGTPVYYCYQVENTGDVTFNFHDLVDTELGTLLNDFPYTLAPGAFSPEVIVADTPMATVTNVGTWTALTALGTYAYDDQAPFNYIPINTTGTPLGLTDDGEANITLPFAFTFYGVTSSNLRVGNNGGILFNATTGDVPVTNAALPVASPALSILPFWDDIDSDTGDVYWEVQGTAPNRMAIVEWYNRPHFSNTGAATFEAILYEGTNEIKFQYLDTDFGNATYNAGVTATAGINKDATTALQYSFNQPVLTNNKAIRFYEVVPVSATDTDTATVTVQTPNIDVTPLSLSETHLTPPQVTTKPLTVANTGQGDLTWQIAEEPTGVAPAPLTGGDAAVAVDLVDPSDFKAPEQHPVAVPLSDWRAPEAVLYDNGGLVTAPAGGAGGADLSALQSALGLNTYGFGNQASAGNRVADDFTVTGSGWLINTITFFGYQTGSTTTSTFTALNLRIWDGPPNLGTSNVVFGDTTTNRLASSTWSNIYRALDTTPLDSTRPIMANVVTVNTFLPAGTYWLDWQAAGSLASGPWAPPVSILGQTGKPGANALQYTSTGWAALVDTGASGTSNFPQDLPFIVDGLADCANISDVPWLSVSPTSGTNTGGTNTATTVTFDSASLADGVYTANLCVTSNDPDLGPGNGTNLVIVPVTLVVGTGTAVTLGGLSAAQAPAPIPAALPLAALPAAAGLAMAAVYALRRRK